MPRALVVDDIAENRYFLDALLAAHGYEVKSAGNGVEALAAARSARPDLIISDILMPGMDGFVLCRECRQDPELRLVPFVFYTATYTDPKDEQFAMGLGADLFIVKPTEPDVFMEKVTHVLRQHKAGELRHDPATGGLSESTYLREYNAALVHKLEQKLVELEHVSKVRTALLSAVSHELRTPLTPVMLLVDLLQRDPQFPPHMREDLQTIRAHIEIEKRLIGDLLDYAAMHSGNLQLHRTSVSLHALLDEIVALWREEIHSRHLQLTIEKQAINESVTADRDRLRQTLWNLVQNAVRFNPAGGSICLRTSNPQPRQVAVEITDTGKGMDAQTIAWIFAPFEGDTRVGDGCERGLGLGLAISKGVVEAHGGAITVHSEGQGRGTSAMITLPLAATGARGT